MCVTANHEKHCCELTTGVCDCQRQLLRARDLLAGQESLCFGPLLGTVKVSQHADQPCQSCAATVSDNRTQQSGDAAAGKLGAIAFRPAGSA